MALAFGSLLGGVYALWAGFIAYLNSFVAEGEQIVYSMYRQGSRNHIRMQRLLTNIKSE